MVGQDFETELLIDKNDLKFDSNLIVAEAKEIVIFALETVLLLVVTDAYGAELSYNLTFTLANGSITASMLSDMGAMDGDVLIYNAAAKAWQPKPLNGLSFQGTWDVSSGRAPIDVTPLAGEYWIVSKNGEK